MTVATVLRSGGIYHPGWVVRLERMVRAHAPNTDFVCLTDTPFAPFCRPLEHDWPGWWAKMCLFGPDTLRGVTLYVDLDTDIVNTLDGFGDYRGDVAMLSDFNRPDLAQSGVMLIRPDKETQRLWALWLENPDGWMQTYRGDGEWLHEHARADRIQDLYPRRVVSYKNDCCRRTPGKPGQVFHRIPDGASIVVYHGAPKPDVAPWT